MKKLFFAFSILAAFQVFAQEEVDVCTHKMLLSHFPQPFVENTLKKFDVPQDKWNAILENLAEKDQEVVSAVEAEAAKQDPNPLRDPRYRQKAIRIFRSVVERLFVEAMQEGGVTDSGKIRLMLTDVLEQKAEQYSICVDRLEQMLPE